MEIQILFQLESVKAPPRERGQKWEGGGCRGKALGKCRFAQVAQKLVKESFPVCGRRKALGKSAHC